MRVYDEIEGVRQAEKFRVLIPIASHAVIFLLFLLEYALFSRYVTREVAPFYPPYFDQAFFLTETYRLYDAIRGTGSRVGWVKVLLGEFFSSDAQGHLMHIQTNIFMLHAGASRFTALVPGFAYFIVLQYAFFHVARKLTENYAMGFIIVGLMLSVSYPFYFAGALFDYRLDFIAFCVYGLFAASVVASDSFLARRGAVYATLVAWLLVLFRHVTVAYVGITYLVMLVIIAAFYVQSGSIDYKKECVARMKHIIASGISILVVMAPFVWLSRLDIYNYYGRHHVLGLDREFRLAHAKVHDFLSNLLYYPARLREHVGPSCFSMILLFLLLAFVLIVIKRINERKPPRAAADGPEIPTARSRILLAPETYVFLALLVAIPIAIITFDYNKSPVVAAGVIPPLLLFIVLAFSNALRGAGASFPVAARSRSRALWDRYAGLAIALLATAVFLNGLNNQVVSYNRPSALRQVEGFGTIPRMYEEVGDWALKNGKTPLFIAVDRISDYLTNGTFSIVYFERRGEFLPVMTALGSGLRTIPREEILAGLRASDAVFFSDSPAAVEEGFKYVYPYDAAIDELRPELLKIIAEEFEFFGEYEFDGKSFQVYVRPGAKGSLEKK